MPVSLINLFYLLAAVLFILALKGLQNPRTAVRGNLLGALGMLVAVVVTLLNQNIVSFEVILAGLIVGSVVGATLALKIRMTAMPQMVALLNGFGGGASFLVAGAALYEGVPAGVPQAQFIVAAAAAGIIGSVTFWGSVVAFGKLQGLIYEKPLLVPGRHYLNAVLGVVVLGLGAWLVADPSMEVSYWALVVVAALLGVMVVLPIGGADMPVAISLLNSYSGLAAAAAGFVLGNNALIISGSLVGAAGFILTQSMSQAMNRSLFNILSGAIAAGGAKVRRDDVYTKVKSATAEDVAMLLDAARRVVVVPGYGMAVSQAQYAVRDLTTLLESKGAEVEFAIHPVAGRMPGHMNVLLAEANISYDRLKGLEEINPTFPQTDVAIVIGANDVVNPVARDVDSGNPLAGMPILEVDKARTVVVVKRSLSPGFAGIPNPLFAADNTVMYFSDGKKAVQDIIAALKAL